VAGEQMKRDIASGKLDDRSAPSRGGHQSKRWLKNKISLGSTAEIFWPHGNRRSDLKRKKDGGLKRRAEGILF